MLLLTSTGHSSSSLKTVSTTRSCRPSSSLAVAASPPLSAGAMCFPLPSFMRRGPRRPPLSEAAASMKGNSPVAVSRAPRAAGCASSTAETPSDQDLPAEMATWRGYGGWRSAASPAEKGRFTRGRGCPAAAAEGARSRSRWMTLDGTEPDERTARRGSPPRSIEGRAEESVFPPAFVSMSKYNPTRRQKKVGGTPSSPSRSWTRTAP
mmetsp:Transcript_31171/g.93456  ORF Transcript_31171/g.93456 Transcript_31171/m.93456 type:complete len:208 (-) Transcript_31171:1359-1982(-)